VRNAKTRDEHGCENVETEHRVLNGEQIRDENTANVRGAGMETCEEDKSEIPRMSPMPFRDSEERPLCLS